MPRGTMEQGESAFPTEGDSYHVSTAVGRHDASWVMEFFFFSSQVFHFENVKDVPFGFQTVTSDVNKLSSFYSLKLIKRLYVDKSLNPSTVSRSMPFPVKLTSRMLMYDLRLIKISQS